MPYNKLEFNTAVIENKPSVFVDLVFPVQAKSISVQHGYSLYSTICHIIGDAHNQLDFKLLTLAGHKAASGILTLPDNTTLKIRTASENIPAFLALAGKHLEVEGHSLRLGIPRPYLLKPCAALYSRLVIIKGYIEEEPFKEAVLRQLQDLDVQATCEIPRQPDGSVQRRILKVKNQSIVGFGVLLRGLSAEESLRIMTNGIGGKQKMGAGFFVPAKVR